MGLFPLEAASLPSMCVSVQPVASLTSPHSVERPSLQTVFITLTLPSQHPFDYSKAQTGVGLVTAHFLLVDLGLFSNALTQSRAPCDRDFQRLPFSQNQAQQEPSRQGQGMCPQLTSFSLFPSEALQRRSTGACKSRMATPVNIFAMCYFLSITFSSLESTGLSPVVRLHKHLTPV